MEEEFISNQERLKPQEEKNEEERSKVDDLRGEKESLKAQLTRLKEVSYKRTSTNSDSFKAVGYSFL